MSLFIYEVKENGEYNIKKPLFPVQKELGNDQLRNYEVAKMLGAAEDDEWYEWQDRVLEYRRNNGEIE